MRFASCFALAAALLLPAAVHAQQISLAGWVQRVDAANATLTIRTLDNPRTIPVAPNAVISVNGVVSRLDQLPFNSSVSIIAEKGPDAVLRATQISAQSTGRQPAAAAPAGAIVRGRLVGMNIPAGTITLRTPSGDYPVSLGTPPIYVNGGRGSSRDLRIGQRVEVDRTLPTEASTDYVTTMVHVLSSGGQMAATGGQPAGTRASSAAVNHLSGAGVVDRGGALTRTRGSVTTYRSRRTRTYHRVRTRRRVRYYQTRRRSH